jgi:hypothetical protein
MFTDFSTRAQTCSEEIAAFNALYVKSASTFEAAAQSRRKNPSGVGRLAVGDVFLAPSSSSSSSGDPQGRLREDDGERDTEMPNAAAATTTAPTRVKREDDHGEKEKGEQQQPVENTKEEDVDDVIEEFGERLIHRDVDVDVSAEDERKLLRITLPAPASLLFMIDITSERGLVVTGVRNVKNPGAVAGYSLHTGILRAVTGRQWPGNLEMLLEMCASYKTIYSARCEKCKKLTKGGKSELPVVRRLVGVDKGRGEKRWAAMHETCL